MQKTLTSGLYFSFVELVNLFNESKIFHALLNANSFRFVTYVINIDGLVSQINMRNVYGLVMA